MEVDASDAGWTVVKDGVTALTASEVRLVGPSGVGTAIDALGVASGVAQGLKGPLTRCCFGGGAGLACGQRLYVLRRGQRVCGFLKIGAKHLFYWTQEGATVELDPLCALDFYVDETLQRSGHGKALFDAMLRGEAVEARQVAVDRPSPKMTTFLDRHYGLRDHVPQPNNFVVFDAYFDAPPA